MTALDAVQFLIDDHGDKGSGARGDFAMDRPIKSILQRSGKTLDDMLDMFDWKEDDASWTAEYDNQQNSIPELIKYRRRVCFSVCGWREVLEDFGRGDVACMGDLRTPFVASRTPLKVMKDEFDIKEQD